MRIRFVEPSLVGPATAAATPAFSVPPCKSMVGTKHARFARKLVRDGQEGHV